MEKRFSAAYPLFMLTLCVLSLFVLMLDVVYRHDGEVTKILDYADFAICMIFLADFGLSLKRAPNKWRYLVTWGWIDLLSSVPALDVARWGRVARIARIARLLRALRASRSLTAILVRERGQSAALMAALIALILIIGSSAAVLRFEEHPDSNIRTAGDAIWWAMTTITTVGYGDTFPRSNEGRFIAALLMTAGVGLFGAFSASLAAWFLAPEDVVTKAEISALRQEIAQLRDVITAAAPQSAPVPPSPGRSSSAAQ
ncbi:MAG TPA: potassium channel family protein [Thermoanaerobaculia bacterium]|jgi:voltage-gated potassium channel